MTCAPWSLSDHSDRSQKATAVLVASGDGSSEGGLSGDRRQMAMMVSAAEAVSIERQVGDCLQSPPVLSVASRDRPQPHWQGMGEAVTVCRSQSQGWHMPSPYPTFPPLRFKLHWSLFNHINCTWRRAQWELLATFSIKSYCFSAPLFFGCPVLGC